MFADLPENDVIDVRPDERFDEQAVAAYLRGRLPGSGGALTVRQFGGGAANLTYLLDYGTHQYVLRRPPLGPVPRGAHDMGREYRVLSVLHQVLSTAPRAFLYESDPALIGAPFFVMERRHGIVVRRTLPPQFDGMRAPRRMSEALVDALVDLHAVDYAALGLSDLGRPAGFIERQIAGWHRRWQRAQTAELPAMVQTHAWLVENVPSTADHTLVHNDYKLDNVMLAADDPGRVVAIFDWDMCTLGDPLSDLGALLAYWSEPADPPYFKKMASMPTGELGFASRRELVERYATKSGRSLAQIEFYYALSLYRLAVILAQIYIRYARGQTQDARFARLGGVIPLVAQAALDVAEGQVRI